MNVKRPSKSFPLKAFFESFIGKFYLYFIVPELCQLAFLFIGEAKECCILSGNIVAPYEIIVALYKNHKDAEKKYRIGKQQSLPSELTLMLISRDSALPPTHPLPLLIGCVVIP